MLIVTLTQVEADFGSVGSVGTGGTTNGVFLTDGAYFNVALRNLTTTYRDGALSTVNIDFNGSDLNALAWESSNCVIGHDTCVFDEDYGDNGLNGWNACDATYGTYGSHPNKVCDNQWVRINTFYNPPAVRIACHEIAHSVGLRHNSDIYSCVMPSSSGGVWSFLSSTDLADINSHY
jgi:hypothetical protein